MAYLQRAYRFQADFRLFNVLGLLTIKLIYYYTRWAQSQIVHCDEIFIGA